MTAIVPALSPDIARNTLDFADPAVIAGYLELAAARIKSYGKVTGEWWKVIDPATGFPGLLIDYRDESPTDVIGAIAVELGYRTNREVFETVCGLNDEDNGADRRSPHPVLAALMRALGYAKVESVFAWSDERRDDQVVDRLREIAAELRAQAVA